MIELISIADADIENASERTVLVDCNGLPVIDPLSTLHREHGNDQRVLLHYKGMIIARRLVREWVGDIETKGLRFVAFHSERGLYRGPAIATLVGQELCDRGHRVFLTHLRLPVVSEELVPTRKVWGYDA